MVALRESVRNEEETLRVSAEISPVRRRFLVPTTRLHNSSLSKAS